MICIEKVCVDCGMSKPIDAFGIEKRNSDNRRGRCKACRSKQCHENGAYLTERLRKYAYRHGFILVTVDDIERLMRQRTCTYCGVEMDGGNNEPTQATADHIYPPGEYGGTNLPENFVPACRGCNASKGREHVYGFYLRSDKFTPELFRAFTAKFYSRLIGRELSESEVEQAMQYLADEYRDLLTTKSREEEK